MLAVETDWRVADTSLQYSSTCVRGCEACPTARQLSAPVGAVLPILYSYCRCTPVDCGKVSAGGGLARGGLLAALVLGSAQVQLPAALREPFCVAGLSHALAAFGFHSSVVPGSVLAVGRGLSRLLRVFLGCCALIVILTLARGGGRDSP